jgi:small subunit ribosomal protein S8
MVTDPIANMLTSIRNAVRSKRGVVDVPFSRVKLGLAQALKAEGFLYDCQELDAADDSVSARDKKHRKILRIVLKYGPEGEDVIRFIRRWSSPGCRKYLHCTKIPKVLNGLGCVILSTNKGIMSDRLARQQRLGGEALCVVW